MTVQPNSQMARSLALIVVAAACLFGAAEAVRGLPGMAGAAASVQSLGRATALTKFAQDNWLCAMAKPDGSCAFYYDDTAVYEWTAADGKTRVAVPKKTYMATGRAVFDYTKMYDAPASFAHAIPGRVNTALKYQCAEFVTRALIAGGFLPELTQSVKFGGEYFPFGEAEKAEFKKGTPSNCPAKRGHCYNLGWTSRNCGAGAGLHEYLRDVKGWAVLPPSAVDRVTTGTVVFMTSPGHKAWQHVVVGIGKGRFAGHNHAAFNHDLVALLKAGKHVIQAILAPPSNVALTNNADATWKAEQANEAARKLMEATAAAAKAKAAADAKAAAAAKRAAARKPAPKKL